MIVEVAKKNRKKLLTKISNKFIDIITTPFPSLLSFVMYEDKSDNFKVVDTSIRESIKSYYNNPGLSFTDPMFFYIKQKRLNLYYTCIIGDNGDYVHVYVLLDKNFRYYKNKPHYIMVISKDIKDNKCNRFHVIYPTVEEKNNCYVAVEIINMKKPVYSTFYSNVIPVLDSRNNIYDIEIYPNKMFTRILASSKGYNFGKDPLPLKIHYIEHTKKNRLQKFVVFDIISTNYDNSDPDKTKERITEIMKWFDKNNIDVDKHNLPIMNENDKTSFRMKFIDNF